MCVTGNVEAFCAIVLWAGNTTRMVASFCLTVVMANACMTHYWLGQEFGFPMVLMACSGLVCFLSSGSQHGARVAAVSSPSKAKKNKEKAK
jgi:hypothetical protein